MALTSKQLAEHRKEVAADDVVTWDKNDVAAASQAVEDTVPAIKSGIASAIETAAPGKFNAAQKTRIALTTFKRLVREG